LGLSGRGERGQQTYAQRCCHCDSSNVAFHFLILFFDSIVTTQVWQLKPDSLIVLPLAVQVCPAENVIETPDHPGELRELSAVCSRQITHAVVFPLARAGTPR